MLLRYLWRWIIFFDFHIPSFCHGTACWTTTVERGEAVDGTVCLHKLFGRLSLKEKASGLSVVLIIVVMGCGGRAGGRGWGGTYGESTAFEARAASRYASDVSHP